MLESRTIKGSAIWIGLWILGFSLNALLLQLGIPLHGSYVSSLMLGLRDLLLLGIRLYLRKRWFPERAEEQSWGPSGLAIWGTSRLRWRSPWTPFVLHYFYYLSALLGKAWS